MSYDTSTASIAAKYVVALPSIRASDVCARRYFSLTFLSKKVVIMTHEMPRSTLPSVLDLNRDKQLGELGNPAD
jgi:hypothetical protein